MEEEILLCKGGLKTVELLICEEPSGWDIEMISKTINGGETIVWNLWSIFLLVRNADLKMLTGKKAQKIYLILDFLAIDKAKHLEKL